MIYCCLFLQESVSTLDYAAKAKNIKNHPEVNQRLAPKDLFKVEQQQ